MTIRERRGIYWITALFLAVVLVLGVLHGCKRQEDPDSSQADSPNDVAVAPVAKTPAADPLQAAANLFREPKASLQAIINGASQRWDAIAKESWGTLAPDFTLTDLDGNSHKLSDYRGKDVVVVFWASWCSPCKLEVPHLKELRAGFPADKLAILSVTNEAAALAKTFVSEQGINYTVLLNPGVLTSPYSEISQYVPSSIFIDPEGKIKLAARGVVPAADAKAIIQAQ